MWLIHSNILLSFTIISKHQISLQICITYRLKKKDNHKDQSAMICEIYFPEPKMSYLKRIGYGSSLSGGPVIRAIVGKDLTGGWIIV